MSNKSCHKGKSPIQKVFSKASHRRQSVAFSQICLQQDYSPHQKNSGKDGTPLRYNLMKLLTYLQRTVIEIGALTFEGTSQQFPARIPACEPGSADLRVCETRHLIPFRAAQLATPECQTGLLTARSTAINLHLCFTAKYISTIIGIPRIYHFNFYSVAIHLFA